MSYPIELVTYVCFLGIHHGGSVHENVLMREGEARFGLCKILKRARFVRLFIVININAADFHDYKIPRVGLDVSLFLKRINAA